MTPRVSVIVPTCRRPDLLARTLAALVALNFPAAGCEIIVADDGGDRATRQVVKEVSRRSREQSGPRVRYVPGEPNSGPAAARNHGVRAAEGAVLAFTDDDTIPDPDWLRAGVAALDQGADAVSGRVDVPLPRARPTDYERDAAHLSTAEFVTANCFVRADVFRDLGGFDERFRMAWREDSDLHFRLLDAGYRIASASDALVVHPIRRAPWGVSLRQQRKSRYNALLYKKHKRRYRQQIQARPPLAYYGSIVALAGAAAFARRRSGVACGFGLLWGLATGRFTVQRLRGTEISPTHVTEMAVTSAVIPVLSVFWRLRGAIEFRVRFA